MWSIKHRSKKKEAGKKQKNPEKGFSPFPTEGVCNTIESE